MESLFSSFFLHKEHINHFFLQKWSFAHLPEKIFDLFAHGTSPFFLYSIAMSLLRTLKRAIPETHPLRIWWHRAKAFAAAFCYGFPAASLHVIGITGTDGKTTTVGMTAHILRESGIPVGALSTAFLRMNDRIEPNATQKTSPSPFMIQKFLRRLVNERCTHAVLECSSHGLIQGRTWFTWPKVAGFTNLSAEHLDYHGTMQEYLRAKALLFRMLHRKGTKVLNADDETVGAYRLIPSTHTTLYGHDQKRIELEQERDHEFLLTMSSVHGTGHSISAKLHSSPHNGEWHNHDLHLAIPGTYNIENALCAIGCAHACGVSIEKATHALSTFGGVGGRLERIDEGQNFSVYCDFTVTPASYEKTLSTLRATLPEGKRLLVLTGSCGDRMKEKRPVVGEICSRLADVVVISNEDPYTEKPEQIIDAVWAGVDKSKCEAHRIVDRKEAIRFLLTSAQEGDIVALCGKGSDTTMWVKHGQVPWDERKIAREMLKEIQNR